MKNILKVLAALLVVALPFVVASCSSDDDDDKDKTYNYTWVLNNTALSNGASSAEKLAAAQAEVTINGLIAKAINGVQGFSADAENQSFSITLPAGTEPDRSESLIKSAFFNLQGSEDYSTARAALPAKAQIVIKRGKTEVLKETL